MKKYILAIITALMISTPAHAGMWDSLATSSWKDKKPSAQYKLDVHGYDVRVYEWIPEKNPRVRCVFVAGNKNSSGVSCYKIK